MQKVDVLCLQEAKLTANQRDSIFKVAQAYGYSYMAARETKWVADGRV